MDYSEFDDVTIKYYRNSISNTHLLPWVLADPCLNKIFPPTLARYVNIREVHKQFLVDRCAGVIVQWGSSQYGCIYRFETHRTLYYYVPGLNNLESQLSPYVDDILYLLSRRGGWTIQIVTDWDIVDPVDVNHHLLNHCLSHYAQCYLYGECELIGKELVQYRG
ncbi:hypothetical protein SNEBB_000423 [Seison nebaliae]|nr:hypothetical protein SNEBB_000423 [Seison nebaliae]